MLKNYLKIALRNLQKERIYAFINILGLTVGIAASLLIVVYIADELSYDRFHAKADNIFRVTTRAKISDQATHLATSCLPFAQTAVTEFPEVEEATRLDFRDDLPVAVDDRSFIENHALIADSNFFSVFSFELLQGDKHTALKDPNKVVLTESLAKKYFDYKVGDETPVGKSLKVGDTNFEVSGLVADPPKNAHFDFDLIVSLKTMGDLTGEWTSNNYYTYLVLNPLVNWKELEAKFEIFIEKYIGPEIQQYLGMSLAEFKAQGGDYGFSLQPLTDIHLRSKLDDEIAVNGDITYLYIFGVIAIFIVVIACINFMNLSTARSANRAKEVGVRKTAGATRVGLINQFLTESMLLSLISTLLAMALISILLPVFNTIAGKEISFSSLLDGRLILVFTGLSIFIGLLAGSYPSLFLSSFKPAQVLKGKIGAGFRSSAIRSVLVVFQFTISISLIVSTLIVFKQLNMMQTRNLGFDQENVLIVENTYALGTNKQVFQNELEQYQGIKMVSNSSSLPPRLDNSTVFKAAGENEQDHLLRWYRADFKHLATLGIEMNAGRYFSEDFPGDSSAIILNEAAMKSIGWENHENQKIITFSNGPQGSMLDVIGVVKDYHFESLKNRIRPMAIILGSGNVISVRLEPGNPQEQIQLIESKWKQYAPDTPLTYSFLEDNLDQLYRSEMNLLRIFVIFTSLAIVIACLGLLGLAAYAAEQRSKEISIRKVLGASAAQVMMLMSKDVTKLVAISFVLAAPIAYFFISNWLEGFAYKVNIEGFSFLAGGLMAVLIALLTVGYQSIKVALTNPVNSLRSE